jgi:hypothetical protein
MKSIDRKRIAEAPNRPQGCSFCRSILYLAILDLNVSEIFGECQELGWNWSRAIYCIETQTRFIRWASCNLRDARLRAVTIRQHDRVREIRDEVTRKVLAQDRAQDYQTAGQQHVPSFRVERRNWYSHPPF